MNFSSHPPGISNNESILYFKLQKFFARKCSVLGKGIIYTDKYIDIKRETSMSKACNNDIASNNETRHSVLRVV